MSFLHFVVCDLGRCTKAGVRASRSLFFLLPGRDRLRREMEQSGPFPNPASKLPNLKFYVYDMVALPPLFMGSVDAPRRTRGASMDQLFLHGRDTLRRVFCRTDLFQNSHLVIFLKKTNDFEKLLKKRGKQRATIGKCKCGAGLPTPPRPLVLPVLLKVLA